MATAMTSLSNRNESEIETLPSAEMQHGKFQKCVRSPRKRLVIVVVVTALLAVVVGFLIGYFVPKSKPAGPVINAGSTGTREDVHDKFEDRVSAMDLEEEFR